MTLLLGLLHSSQAQAEDESAVAFFEQKIRPLLVKRCYECHSGTKTKAGLALDSREGLLKGGESGPVIVPGHPEQSLLIEAVNYQGIEMPPRDHGGKLDKAAIADLTNWIRSGAVDPRVSQKRIGGMTADEARAWWSFQPIASPKGGSTPGAIDQIVQQGLSQRNLTQNPRADKRTLIRRASYDLTGLPPLSSEVDAFVADTSPDAFSKLVERLLASPSYGVHWGRRWLDVVRYADTAGENTDRPLPHAWRYRNWVFEAFNRDLPFDEFVRLQIAGDLIRANSTGNARAEGLVATGYLAIARRFGHDIDKDAYLMYEDVIDNVGKSFLGLTTGCARCHDHKYDPITAKDYYALYGIFESTKFSFPGCEPKGQPRDLIPLLTPPEIETLERPWRERQAALAAEKARREATLVPRERLREMAAKSVQLLASATVAEGSNQPIVNTKKRALDPVAIRKGEVLLLTILANENHGADSTGIDWKIARSDLPERRWSLSDVLTGFLESNPRDASESGGWCFLDLSNGPAFLVDRRDANGGSPLIKSWSNGELPSVFVNMSDQPVKVWTTLSPRSVFVHPGPNQPVGIAWVCPEDGKYSIKGQVRDAHPAGLDGVSYRLELIASSEFGQSLVRNGRTLSAPLPEPGPAPIAPVVFGAVDASAIDTRLQQQGDHEKLGEVVPRRWLSVFGGDTVPKGTGSGRRLLAEKIASHPLTARVIVNRVWQGHFGEGLVRSANDFGSRGERPTHPELLEWLAGQFQASGQSIKSLHRLIMNSDTYQSASTLTPALVAIDPENRWLARYPRRRITAEELRDSLMMVAGNLEPAPAAAHPFPAESTWTFTQHNPFSAVYENRNRSAYQMTQRQRRHPFFSLFDGADPNSSTPRRQSTTVPTQALYFLNDPFFHEQARALADRLKATNEQGARVDEAFRLVFQRVPHASEREQILKFLSDYPGSEDERWSTLARILLASNEFLHVD